MAPAVVISEKARLEVLYPNTEFILKVQPFIQKVAAKISHAGDLEASVLQTAEELPDLASCFVINSHGIDETFGLREEYLYGEWTVRALRIVTSDALYEIDLTECPSQLIDIQKILSLCGSGTYDKESIRKQLSDEAIELFDDLFHAGVLIEEQERTLERFAPMGVPGVYRLQHASILYRTPTAGILVDPHIHSTYRPELLTDFCVDQLAHKVDAILISHFHFDHWFLSTLLMFPRDTPIVVPKMPCSSIICGDMQGLLKTFGFKNVITPDWYSTLKFKDLEVHVLPFYGEQPLRFELPKDGRIRNWGNTYAVLTDHYTSWFLIDSGNDALGSMNQVAFHVRQKIGAIDWVLSNLRSFNIVHPLYINGGSNWLTLSARQIRDFDSMQSHCITLATSGVAEVCRTVAAKYYLPYAHWWGELRSVGQSALDTPNQRETDLLLRLGDEIKALGIATQIIPWKIGDGFCPYSGGFRCVPL